MYIISLKTISIFFALILPAFAQNSTPPLFNDLNAAEIIKVWKDYVWLCSTPIVMSQKKPDIGTGQDK